MMNRKKKPAVGGIWLCLTSRFEPGLRVVCYVNALFSSDAAGLNRFSTNTATRAQHNRNGVTGS